MRRILGAVAGLLLAVPVAIITTFVLLPFWRWFETATGVQAVGHASLADWCFAVTWAVLALPAAWFAWRVAGARRVVSPPDA